MKSEQSALVTVIIPFFNEESVIEKSIESVLQQSYTEIELILIDDQSTDKSYEICKTYRDKHNHVSLYQSEDKGLGSSRNLGVKLAKGDFIMYLDADDILKPNMLRVLVEQFSLHPHTDIAISKYDYFQNNLIKYQGVGWKSERLQITGEDAVNMMYSGKLVHTVWAKLYRKSLIEHILFPLNLWFEDRPYMLTAFLNSKGISLVDQSLLNNMMRQSSISHRTISKRRLVDMIQIFELELDIIEPHEKAKKLEKHVISFHLNTWLENLCLMKLEQQKIENLNEVKAAYRQGIEKLEIEIKKRNLVLTSKQRGFIQILKMYRFLPWSIYLIVVCRVIFEKRFKRVRSLKGLS